jgi:hypothetical protein
MGTGGEHIAASLAADEILDGGIAGSQHAERRIRPELVVKTATRTTNETAFAIAGKGLVNRRAGAQIHEVQWNPDAIPRPRSDAVEDGSGGGVCLGFYGSFMSLKNRWFF